MTGTLAIPFAHVNVQQPDPRSHRQATIQALSARARGGCATVNEAAKDADYIRSLVGFHAYIVGENAVIWDSSFVPVKRAHYLVMRGGRAGAGRRRRDRRRRGPSRYVVAVVLRDPHTGAVWTVATYHAIAKADTSARWRRALRRLGLRVAGRRLAVLTRLFPDGIVTGDLNAVGPVNFPNLQERPVPTPATFGRLRYDRLFTIGNVRLRNVGTFKARSDHLGLTADMTVPGRP